MAFLGKQEVFGEMSFLGGNIYFREEAQHIIEETLLSGGGEAWLFGEETRLSAGKYGFFRGQPGFRGAGFAFSPP